MSNDDNHSEDKVVEYIRSELSKVSPTRKKKIFEKFALAALGSIPWVGGFISAAASLKIEEGGLQADDLRLQWLKEHQRKMERLCVALADISSRFEKLGDQINDRIQSEEYLDLVRKSFRTWDKADTDEKRKYIANLVSNASGTKLCSDDVIRLFIDWIGKYHEAHFAVISEIYKNPGCTRYDIGRALHETLPREDSAEADLFRLLIRDLSTGGVIRQARDTTEDGRFLRKPIPRSKGRGSSVMESAFEDTKPYVLTELGKQFVHYTMTELVSRVEGQGQDNTS